MLLPILCLLGLLAGSRAEDQPVWNLVAECQVVVLPQKVALPLLGDLLDETKIEAAYARIQEMIASGKAELVGNQIAKMPSGTRGVSETVEELKYATEFEPPSLPQNAPENIQALKEWPLTGITPTAFETRNTGVRLEVEATEESAGRQIFATVVCEHVRFLRWTKIDAGRLASGERLSVEQPIFHTAKSTCTLRLRTGQRVLLGVHKISGAADSLELFLLRITATRAGTP
ncbi:MAG: hypothetical protein K8R23_11930 [Chthoniobacter sp.]|nr:hypothetical protein [Chthoniobacter sp.]